MTTTLMVCVLVLSSFAHLFTAVLIVRLRRRLEGLEIGVEIIRRVVQP
jgi:hypothetical protein